MTSILRTINNPRVATTTNAPTSRKIPKELIKKAAESALISSFVDLKTKASSRKKAFTHQSPCKKVVIEFDIEGSGSATSMFVKSIPPSSSRPLREVKFYEDIFPQLYPKKWSSGGGGSQQTLADCYLSHENGEVMLFLENFQTSFKHCSDPLDFNHALLAVEVLAKFHAQSYFLIRQLGGKAKGRGALMKKFPWLQELPAAAADSDTQAPKLSFIYKNFFERIMLKAVESENPGMAFKLQRKYQDPSSIWRRMKEVLENEKYENDDLYVIAHGDFIHDNLLFKYGKQEGQEQEPEECRMVDLKNVRLAPLASDLVYFMFNSLGSTVREEFEEKLIAFYCDSFEAQLSMRYHEVGDELSKNDFDVEDFHRKVEDQYKRMLEYGFYSSVVALPLLMTGLSSGRLENLEQVYLPGGKTVLESLEDADKFQQFAKECLNYDDMRENMVGIGKRLIKARIA